MTAHEYLAEEFNRRQLRNKQYSLRAFARDLDLSPAFLSQFLSGKRGLSSQKAKTILEKVEWSDEKKDFFCSLVESSLVKKLRINTNWVQENLEERLNALEIKESEFKLIADWYYYAILELTTTKNFKSDVSWVSQKLKIPPQQAQEALNRLQKLNLLEIKRGRFKRKINNYQIKDVPSQAIREHHHQSLDLAHKALEEQPLEKREFGSSTLAVEHSDLPAIKEKIKKFSEKLIKEYSSQNGDSVYKLSVQLFELG